MTSNLPLGLSGSMAVTDAAASFMRRMIRFGGKGPKAGFRLVVTAGGCAGLSSDFSIEAAPGPGDASLAVPGLTLFLPTSSFELLSSVIVDFVDTPTQAGLVFFDPKATSCATEPARPELVQLDKPAP